MLGILYLKELDVSWYRYESEVLILNLYIQPGAKKHAVVGIMEDKLKIKLPTQAIEGRANQALIAFLSKFFKVPKSYVSLKSGAKSRHKCVAIKNPQHPPELLLFNGAE